MAAASSLAVSAKVLAARADCTDPSLLLNSAGFCKLVQLAAGRLGVIMKTGASRLRQLIAREVPPVVPLALDPISAKLAQRAGFEALYLGGGTLGYVQTCTDANLTLTQMAHA